MLKKKIAYAGLSILLLIVCLVAVNVVGYFIPIRWDITGEKLFTVSSGTKKIVEGIKDPVAIKFYYSKSISELPPTVKVYGQRVMELLEEYATLSKGNIKVEQFDPKPDSEEEEWAQKYGVSPISLPSGSSLYLGMVITQLDREVPIPFIDPRREEYLEFDISQALLKVTTAKQPKIGVVTSVTTMFGQGGMRGRQGAEEWAAIGELKKNFQVENLDPGTTEEIPDDITLLLVVAPKDFSERLHYAIDQYVLRGGRLVVLVDPSSREAQQNQMMSQFGPPPSPSSDLPQLFATWGVEFNPAKLIGDFRYATQVSGGSGGVIRYPLWMSFNKEAMEADSPITSQLDSLMMIDAGEIKKKADAQIEFTPFLSTSAESGFIDAAMTRFGGPETILRELKSDNTKKVIAASIKGSFKTAFPAGQPAKAKKEKEEDQAKDKADAKKEEDVPLKHAHAMETKEANTIFVVADTDFIADSFSVQKMNFLGQTIVQPTNDNLNFLQNTVEFMSGNDSLMSVRSRGRFTRPFLRLLALEQRAAMRYQEEEGGLQKTLNEIREKLQSLEHKKDGKEKLTLTPELQQDLKKFKDEELAVRKRLREVRKILRQDVESLGNWLLALNLLVVPIGVSIAGVTVYTRRMQRRSKS